MNDDDRMTDRELEPFLAAARATTAVPDAGLLARLLGDAETVQGGFAAVPDAAPSAAGQDAGFWRSLMAMIGGWQAATGLMTATLAGLWIGISPPEPVSGVALSLLGENLSVEFSDELPSFEDYLTEG